MNKRLVLFVILWAFGGIVLADSSRWSTSINYAQFKPNLENWDQGYDDKMQGVQANLGYKLTSMVELGLGVSYFSASGKGILPLNNSSGGRVKYHLLPVDVYVEFQARFIQDQWLVPYAAAGYSGLYYKLAIASQADRDGKADGVHYKLGLRLLLNKLDAIAAKRLQQGWGIESTQFILEAKKLDVKKSGLDLGGDIYSLGLRFEF